LSRNVPIGSELNFNLDRLSWRDVVDMALASRNSELARRFDNSVSQQLDLLPRLKARESHNGISG
jgi:hypothetical protein